MKNIIDSESWWEGKTLMFRIYEGRKPITISESQIKSICRNVDVVRQCNIEEIWRNNYFNPPNQGER